MLVMVLLWLPITAVSYVDLNEPIGLRFDFLTAHTVLSTRYYERCSFAPTLGASVVLADGPEMDCRTPLRTSPVEKVIYLSYPSLWLDFPLLAFLSVSKLTHLEMVQVIRHCTLILVRAVVLLFTLILTIGSLRVPGRNWPMVSLGALCIAPFAWTPGFIHYTQNVYFADMAVIPPVLGLTIFVFQKGRSGRTEKFAIFLFSLLAAGSDWYGAIVIIFLVSWITIRSIVQGRPIRRIFANILPIAIGALTAAIIYIVQLAALEPGLDQIRSTAGLRFSLADPFADGGHASSGLIRLYHTFAGHFGAYSPLDGSGIFPFLLYLLLPIFALALSYRGGGQTRSIILLLTAANLVHSLIFVQHSSIHDFSPLKWVPLASISLASILGSFYSMIGNRLVLRLGALCIILFVLLSIPTMEHRYSKYAHMNPVQEMVDRQYTELLRAMPKDRILVSIEARTDFHRQGKDLSAGPFPPMRAAMTNRFVYTRNAIHRWRYYWRMDAMRLPVTFIGFASSVAGNGWICEGKWKDSARFFSQESVYYCNDAREASEVIKQEILGHQGRFQTVEK